MHDYSAGETSHLNMDPFFLSKRFLFISAFLFRRAWMIGAELTCQLREEEKSSSVNATQQSFVNHLTSHLTSHLTTWVADPFRTPAFFHQEKRHGIKTLASLCANRAFQAAAKSGFGAGFCPWPGRGYPQRFSELV